MIVVAIDMQKQIMNEGLYEYANFINNIQRILSCAREHHVEVVYVRHEDGEGGELVKGSEGFEIEEACKPIGNEKIFDKRYNSAFKETGLLDYLKEKNEQDIMIIGLQTEYCIDATIKSGFEHGFHVLVPNGSNTTFDNQYMSGEQTYLYYNEFIWKNRYAECISVDKACALLQTKK